jgi:hypothetical protein
VGADARDVIDAAVRQAVETKTALDRFRNFLSGGDVHARTKEHQSLSAQLQQAVKDLEGVVELYPAPSERKKDRKTTPNPFTPGSVNSSLGEERTVLLEEGLKKTSIADLKRVEREMISLHKIYQSLQGQAMEQQSAIETIASNLVTAEVNTERANKELLISQNRQDSRTRWKIYIFLVLLLILVIYALSS